MIFDIPEFWNALPWEIQQGLVVAAVALTIIRGLPVILDAIIAMREENNGSRPKADAPEAVPHSTRPGGSSL